MRATEVFEIQEDNLLRRIIKRYAVSGLRYGWKSNNEKTYDHGHWNNLIIRCLKDDVFDMGETPMIQNHPDIITLWDKIKHITGSDKILMRCYINGYTYGTDAYAHADDIWYPQRYGADCKSETTLIYLNEKWDIDWAGETVIFDGNDIEKSILPKFGRTLVFDSRKMHAARPVSRACPALRLIIAFKAGDVKTRSKKIDFLLPITKDIKHSNKSFFEHLFYTSLILQDLKTSSDVISAGLFHSIYSTEYFKHSLIIPRERVRDLIGEYAEMLVYEFCNMKNRYESLINNTNGYSETVLQDLRMIEGANLREQNFSGKHNSHLAKISELTKCNFLQ